jgi:hypothetical protein
MWQIQPQRFTQERWTSFHLPAAVGFPLWAFGTPSPFPNSQKARNINRERENTEYNLLPRPKSEVGSKIRDDVNSCTTLTPSSRQYVTGKLVCRQTLRRVHASRVVLELENEISKDTHLALQFALSDIVFTLSLFFDPFESR